MARRPRILLAAALTLLGLVGLLLAAELAYRWRVHGRPEPLRYYRQARIVWMPVRETDNGRARINRLGLRGADVELEKAAGVTRILTVGASTTFDPCVENDSSTWSVRLEHWLEQLAPEREFEVLNAGVSGISMLDQLMRMQTELWQLEPDVVVVYAGHGIVTAEHARERDRGDPRRPDMAPDISATDRWLRRHSTLYRRLSVEAPDIDTTPLDETTWARAIDNVADGFERDLTSYSLVAQGLGARVVFVEIQRVSGERSPAQLAPAERAVWDRAYGPAAELVHDGYVRFDSVWQSVADSTGATYITADRIGVTGSENYCAGDPIHFSPAGSELMARRLAEQLLATEAL